MKKGRVVFSQSTEIIGVVKEGIIVEGYFDDDEDGDHLHQHGQQAWDDARHEQLSNVLLCEDGVDRQHGGGRQHRTQGAAGCNHASGERLGVAKAAHLGISHRRKRGSRCHR